MTVTRVLLVDDHILLREGLASIIDADPDFTVVGEADDGLEAIVKAGELSPDLILMDVTMPGCDGIEATATITRDLPETVIVMLTVHTEREKLFEAIKAPPRCAGLFERIRITAGDWLVPGQELHARQTTVPALTPAVALPETTPAPPDTMAYLLFQEQHDTEPEFLLRLAALREDGSVRALFKMGVAQPVWGPAGTASPSMQMLFSWRTTGCSYAWFFLYDPQHGFTRHRLTAPDWPTGSAQGLWQPGRSGALLLTSRATARADHASAEERWRYGMLKENEAVLASAAGSFDASWWPAGRGTDDNLVVIERDHDEAATLRRFDLETESVVRSYTLVGEDVSMTTMSPDGSRLYYLTNDHTTLRQFDLTTERDIVLFRAAEDERLWINLGRQPAEGMLAFTGPAIAGRPRYEQLLLLHANEPEQPTTIAQPEGGELGTPAIPCSDGRVIYAVEQDDEWAVRIWEPDGTTRTMFTASTYVIPWACRLCA